MKKTAITIILAFISFYSFAQVKYLKDVEDTQQLSNKIVELFQENKISKSFEELTPYWPMPQNELDALEEKTIKYINIIEQRYGQSIGKIKVRNEKISKIAIRETYLIQYEYMAIRVIITYYKNDNGWIINAFKWDDSFEKEFD